MKIYKPQSSAFYIKAIKKLWSSEADRIFWTQNVPYIPNSEVDPDGRQTHV